MATNPQETNGFTETTEMPRGRKAREISDEIWNRLEDSAKRSVAFVKSGKPDVIDELRRDLGSAAVRAKYEVTVETDKTNDKIHKLKFSARLKPAPEPETAPETAPAPASA